MATNQPSRLQVQIPFATRRALRIAAIEAGVPMGQAVTEAVEQWIASRTPAATAPAAD